MPFKEMSSTKMCAPSVMMPLIRCGYLAAAISEGGSGLHKLASDLVDLFGDAAFWYGTISDQFVVRFRVTPPELEMML